MTTVEDTVTQIDKKLDGKVSIEDHLKIERRVSHLEAQMTH
jgi:hypothetical protein